MAFQGKIVAAATHEFQNHLAVIKEYNGLVRDLLGARKPDRKTLKRCAEISLSIEERAVRAAQLTDTLNSFAHRGDRGKTGFRVDEALAELVTLMQREAAGRKVSLTLRGSDPVNIISDPALVQLLVFMVASRRLESIGTGGSLVMSAAPREGGALVGIETRPAPAAAGTAVLSGLAECLDWLGASLEEETEDGTLMTTISFSSRPLAR